MPTLADQIEEYKKSAAAVKKSLKSKAGKKVENKMKAPEENK